MLQHDANPKCLDQCLPPSVPERKHSIHAGKLNFMLNAIETVALPAAS